MNQIENDFKIVSRLYNSLKYILYLYDKAVEINKKQSIVTV